MSGPAAVAAPAPEARDAARRAFVASQGLGSAEIALLAGDASFRKYFRLRGGRRSLVLMDAPPPHEDVRPFVRIAEHLRALGLSAPEIFAQDARQGFLLLEDFGDETYARVLARGLPAHTGGDEAGLYQLAVDALAALHAHGARALPPGLAAYDGAYFVEVAAFLVDWYLAAARGRPATADEKASYVAAWRETLPALAGAARTLVLRDYHVDNLVWLPDRPGARACGLLDFQDAMAGAASYDLMSLVEDARRDVPDALRTECLGRYAAAARIADRAAFDAACAVTAAQRHSRVIGQFVRLDVRDGKPQYLRHLPRLWRLFDRALEHPALIRVRRWVDVHLPPDRRGLPR